MSAKTTVDEKGGESQDGGGAGGALGRAFGDLVFPPVCMGCGQLCEGSALQHVCRRCDALMMRVAVLGGGCSGFQYKFDFDETVNDDDQVFERDGVKVGSTKCRSTCSPAPSSTTRTS